MVIYKGKEAEKWLSQRKEGEIVFMTSEIGQKEEVVDELCKIFVDDGKRQIIVLWNSLNKYEGSKFDIVRVLAARMPTEKELENLNRHLILRGV